MKLPPFDPVVLPRMGIWTLIFIFVTITVADPDLWGHVLFGMDIIRDWSLPSADPYSFTSDRPWVNHEWLSEVAMGAAYLAAGPSGLGALKSAVLLTGLVALAAELRARQLQPVAVDVLLVFVVMCSLPLTKTFRPQAFSVLLFVILLACLRRVEDGRTRCLVIVPLLFIPWANLHGGWLVGIGVLGLWTSIRLLWPLGASRAQWAITGIAAVGATLVTPYGVGLWRFLFDTVRFGRADISEWQSVTAVPWPQPLLWAIPVVILGAGVLRERPRLTHVSTTILLGVASFRVVRLIPFLVIATVCLIGPAFRRERPARAAALATGAQAWAIAALFVLAALGAGSMMARRNATCLAGAETWMADQSAAAFIQQAGLRGRMLTWFDWGEYAIWHLQPDVLVSMDGRRETVYSDAMSTMHDTFYSARPGWQEALTKLNPDYIWLPVRLAVTSQLEALGWQKAFASPRSEIFTKLPVETVLGTTQAASCFPD